jgi:hypothetical protein
MVKHSYYSSDTVLKDFYNMLWKASQSRNPEAYINRIHIPVSDVFYVREAIRNSTGVEYSLDHVERAMYLEGHLSRHDVLDPDRKREYADNQ